MKISVLGTGAVGRILSEKLTDIGHNVMMGTRNVQKKLEENENDMYGNPPLKEWLNLHNNVKLVTFAESASFGDIIINATNGTYSLNALDLALEENLIGKVVVDVSNPLDFAGSTPFLIERMVNTNSLGEEIQKEFSNARIVKTFNTMWCGLMVNPGLLNGGNHINYISGNDTEAKTIVRDLIRQFGWRDENIVDLGDITAARAQESFLLIWIRLMQALNTGVFNFALVK